MATSWEYKIEELRSEARSVAELLNEESTEGWDLVTTVEVSSYSGERSLHRLVFRREVTNPTWQ